MATTKVATISILERRTASGFMVCTQRMKWSELLRDKGIAAGVHNVSTGAGHPVSSLTLGQYLGAFGWPVFFRMREGRERSAPKGGAFRAPPSPGGGECEGEVLSRYRDFAHTNRGAHALNGNTATARDVEKLEFHEGPEAAARALVKGAPRRKLKIQKKQSPASDVVAQQLKEEVVKKVGEEDAKRLLAEEKRAEERAAQDGMVLEQASHSMPTTVAFHSGYSSDFFADFYEVEEVLSQLTHYPIPHSEVSATLVGIRPWNPQQVAESPTVKELIRPASRYHIAEYRVEIYAASWCTAPVLTTTKQIFISVEQFLHAKQRRIAYVSPPSIMATLRNVSMFRSLHSNFPSVDYHVGENTLVNDEVFAALLLVGTSDLRSGANLAQQMLLKEACRVFYKEVMRVDMSPLVEGYYVRGYDTYFQDIYTAVEDAAGVVIKKGKEVCHDVGAAAPDPSEVAKKLTALKDAAVTGVTQAKDGCVQQVDSAVQSLTSSIQAAGTSVASASPDLAMLSKTASILKDAAALGAIGAQSEIDQAVSSLKARLQAAGTSVRRRRTAPVASSEAASLTGARAAPVSCKRLYPLFPDPHNIRNHIVGAVKRICPFLAQASATAVEYETEVALALAELSKRHAYRTVTDIEVIEAADLQCKSHREWSRAQAAEFMAGAQLVNSGLDSVPREELERYFVRYGVFVKREDYAEHKALRFIVAPPHFVRGMLFATYYAAFEGWMEAVSTHLIKHCHGPSELAAKIRDTFRTWVLEFDYSSFESQVNARRRRLQDTVIKGFVNPTKQKVFDRVTHCLANPPDGLVALNSEFVSISTQAIRLSGEYCTSLGNGIVNLIIGLAAVFRVRGVTLSGIREQVANLNKGFTILVEGDDGLIGLQSAAEGEHLRAMFLDHGCKMTSKHEVEASDADFCRMRGVAEADGGFSLVRNPIQLLSRVFYDIHPDMNTGHRDHELQVARAMSYLTLYPHLPLVSPVCCSIIEKYRETAEAIHHVLYNEHRHADPAPPKSAGVHGARILRSILRERVTEYEDITMCVQRTPGVTGLLEMARSRSPSSLVRAAVSRLVAGLSPQVQEEEEGSLCEQIRRGVKDLVSERLTQIWSLMPGYNKMELRFLDSRREIAAKAAASCGALSVMAHQRTKEFFALIGSANSFLARWIFVAATSLGLGAVGYLSVLLLSAVSIQVVAGWMAILALSFGALLVVGYGLHWRTAWRVINVLTYLQTIFLLYYLFSLWDSIRDTAVWAMSHIRVIMGFGRDDASAAPPATTGGSSTLPPAASAAPAASVPLPIERLRNLLGWAKVASATFGAAPPPGGSSGSAASAILAGAVSK